MEVEESAVRNGFRSLSNALDDECALKHTHKTIYSFRGEERNGFPSFSIATGNNGAKYKVVGNERNDSFSFERDGDDAHGGNLRRVGGIKSSRRVWSPDGYMRYRLPKYPPLRHPTLFLVRSGKSNGRVDFMR